MSCGVGRRRGLDPVFLWLWCKLATTAQIRPLAWEPPCSVGVALEKTKNKQTNKKQNKKKPMKWKKTVKQSLQ